MVDFNEAVAKELGVRIPITIAEAASGFDELLVIGVREASAANSLTLVQNLVESRRYTAGGMASYQSVRPPTTRRPRRRRTEATTILTGPTISSAARRFSTSDPPSPFDQADGIRSRVPSASIRRSSRTSPRPGDAGSAKPGS